MTGKASWSVHFSLAFTLTSGITLEFLTCEMTLEPFFTFYHLLPPLDSVDQPAQPYACSRDTGKMFFVA